MSITTQLKKARMLLFDLTAFVMMLADNVHFETTAECLAKGASHPDSRSFFAKVAQAAADGKNQLGALGIEKNSNDAVVAAGSETENFWSSEIVRAFLRGEGSSSSPIIGIRLKNLLEYHRFKYELSEDPHVFHSDSIQEVVALRLIGLLIDSGVPLGRALTIAANDNKNQILKKVMLLAGDAKVFSALDYSPFVNYFGNIIAELLRDGRIRRNLSSSFIQASVLLKTKVDLSD